MPINKQLCEERKEMEKHMKALKTQVDDALAKQHEAMTRAVKLAKCNRKLVKDLKAADQLALSVEVESNSVIKDSADKVSKIQEELDDNICKLQQLEEKVMDLIEKNQALKRKNCEIERKSRENKETLLGALQEKDQMLMQQITQEEELRQKIDNMSRTLQNQKQRIMDLELELQECKAEKQKENSKYHSKDTNTSKCKSQPKCSNGKKSTNRSKASKNSARTCCSMGPSSLLGTNHSKDHDSCHGSHSRIIKIHSESPVSHLTLELVGRTTGACDDSTDDCSSSSEEDLSEIKSDTSSKVDIEAIVTRLKRERDIAKCDVERLQTEILALRKRLEAATDVQIEEKCHYEKCLAKEEEKIKKLQLECEGLHKHQSALHDKAQGQEESISKLMTCLDAVRDELEREHSLNKHLKKKVDQKTNDLKNLEQECRRKKNEIKKLDKCNSLQREKHIQMDREVCRLRKEAKMQESCNKTLIDVMEYIDNVQESEEDEDMQHELSNQELQNEVLRLKNSIQEAHKDLYPKSYQGSRSNRIQSIEEERDSDGVMEGCVADVPSHQRDARNEEMVGRKGQKFTDSLEQANKPVKCPQQKQLKSRPTCETEERTIAPPQMKHAKNCNHCKAKQNTRQMGKHKTRHDFKQCDRSHRSPEGSSVRGRYETASPRGKSSSPASKIHVHANVPSGSFVNVELEDNDGSGEDSCYCYSACV